MRTRGIIGWLAVGIIAAALPAAGDGQKPSFQTVRTQAIELHRSLIAYAAPPVKAKIAASALAARDFLAKCGRACDLHAFYTKDLKGRFARAKDDEFRLLEALVFAETVSDMDQLDQLALQDAMQKQSQFLQLMSNISKTVHDTLKAIIQNIRA